MGFLYRFIRPLLTALDRRLVLLVLLLGLLWSGFIGWTSWHVQTDEPLAPERVTAKQIRVDEGRLQRLEADLVSYRQPTAVPEIGSVNFSLSSK